MFISVRGTYREGKVELHEEIPGAEGTEVLVTFLQPVNGKVIDLAKHGISPEMAAELRGRLLPFADDWNAPGMEAYDEL